MNESILRFMFFFFFLIGVYSLSNFGRLISSGDVGSYFFGYVFISNVFSSVAFVVVVVKL